MDNYTREEEDELMTQLKLGYSVKKLAEKYSDKWRRSYVGMVGKLYKLYADLQQSKRENVVIPVEKKEKKEFRFYSLEDVETLTNEIWINNRNLHDIAKVYSEIWDRSYNSLLSKIRSIEKIGKPEMKQVKKEQEFVPVPEPVIPPKETKKVEKEGIKMPDGMIFEGFTKRVVIYPDHFRIYF